MDSVVLLDNGSVAQVDSYEHVKLRSAALMETATADQNSEHTDEDKPTGDGATPSVNEDQETALEKDSLRRRTGSWSVYSYYCRSASVVSLILWVIFTFVGAVAASYTSRLSTTSWLVRQGADFFPPQQYGFSSGQRQTRSTQMRRRACISEFMRCWWSYLLLARRENAGKSTTDKPWSWANILCQSLLTRFTRTFFIHIINDTALKLHDDLLKATLG